MPGRLAYSHHRRTRLISVSNDTFAIMCDLRCECFSYFVRPLRSVSRIIISCNPRKALDHCDLNLPSLTNCDLLIAVRGAVFHNCIIVTRLLVGIYLFRNNLGGSDDNDQFWLSVEFP